VVGEGLFTDQAFTGDDGLTAASTGAIAGKPEQQLPPVGRCSESPHGCVFSFCSGEVSGHLYWTARGLSGCIPLQWPDELNASDSKKPRSARL